MCIAVWLICLLSQGNFRIQAHWDLFQLSCCSSFYSSVLFIFGHFCFLACGSSSLASVESCQETEDDLKSVASSWLKPLKRGPSDPEGSRTSTPFAWQNLITNSECNCYQQGDFVSYRRSWRCALSWKPAAPPVLPAAPLPRLLRKQTPPPVHAVIKSDKVQHWVCGVTVHSLLKVMTQ